MDPHPISQDEIKLELEREFDGLTPEEMALFAADQPPKGRAVDGHGRVRGRILEIRGADVYVDIGGKAEAFLAIDEFDENHPPASGQEHDFVMHGFDKDSGLMRLSLRQARFEADVETLRVNDVIEARVTGVNIGGLELNAHNLRGFMPKSQVDLDRVEDFAPFVGRRLECMITEIDRRGRRVVLSRRKVLERQREEARKAARETLQEGQVRQGVVKRLTDFGAFVDIGGIEGLLHISDISYARLQHPKEALKEGDQVEVKILKLDHERDRISLGRKQLQPDPWDVAIANYRPGTQVDAKVVKLMNFGAFVQLEPGIEGLLPVSEMSWTRRVHHPKELLNEGDSVRVAVLDMDLERRKLTLSLKSLAADPWQGIDQRYPVNTVVSGAVTRLAEFGAFIQLEEGVEGLAHVSELSDKRIRTPGDVVRPGDVVKARIKGVDLAQRRISLSLKDATEKADDVAQTDGAAPAAAAKPKKRKPLRGGLE